MKNCHTKDTLQQTILKKRKKRGWTALDIVGAGSSKFKGIQGRFYLLYPFRLNGESAREHQGALILGLYKREVNKGCLVPSCLACSRVPQSPLRFGKACGGGRNKGKILDNGTCIPRKKYPEKFSTRLEQTEFLY